MWNLNGPIQPSLPSLFSTAVCTRNGYPIGPPQLHLRLCQHPPRPVLAGQTPPTRRRPRNKWPRQGSIYVLLLSSSIFPCFVCVVENKHSPMFMCVGFYPSKYSPVASVLLSRCGHLFVYVAAVKQVGDTPFPAQVHLPFISPRELSVENEQKIGGNYLDSVVHSSTRHWFISAPPRFSFRNPYVD